MKINIITLGCSKNVVDSENLGGNLRKAGFQLCFDRSSTDSDITIVNTCGFIGDAKEESINVLLQQVAIKQRGRKNRKLIAVGCLIQRYQKELAQEIPEIDAYYGVHQWEELVHDLIAEYGSELHTPSSPPRGRAIIHTPMAQTPFAAQRMMSTPKHYAYLKIAEGCDRRCAYCAIPLIRGKYVSRPMEEIVAEAQALVAAGVRELLVIAQDTTYYGIDLYGRRRLAELLNRLATESGADWIRLHYTFPTDFPLDILPVMQRHSNICNYIDIPLQHINSRILSAMHRGISREETIRLIQNIRDMLPDVCLRTTFITGFPGETQEAFEELHRFIADTRFDRIGVFPYSPEEGTAAYLLADDIPDEEKQRRASLLMATQQEISLQRNLSLVGRTLPVLVDRKEGDYYIGRTPYDSPEVDDEVLIQSPRPLTIGSFTSITITDAMEHDLTGTPAEP